MTQKIVWISDIHMTASGQVWGTNCRDRLARVIAELKRYHGDALCCVATGDLTDTGAADEYEAVAGMLSDLPMPVLPLIGNHDARDPFRIAFPPPGQAMSAYQQFRWDIGDVTLLCLDTQVEGADHGALDAARLDWLRDQLAACQDRRVLVFMHHPPGVMWLGLQDEIMLKDEAEFLSILSAATQVDYLFCGHVHRPVSGIVGGVPFTTLRALAHQTRPGHETWDWDSYVAPDERPQYGVILIGEDRLVVQANDLPQDQNTPPIQTGA